MNTGHADQDISWDFFDRIQAYLKAFTETGVHCTDKCLRASMAVIGPCLFNDAFNSSVHIAPKDWLVNNKLEVM
jgi:hypothetical protein